MESNSPEGLQPKARLVWFSSLKKYLIINILHFQVKKLFTIDSKTLGTAVTQVHCGTEQAVCLIFAVIDRTWLTPKNSSICDDRFACQHSGYYNQNMTPRQGQTYFLKKIWS